MRFDIEGEVAAPDPRITWACPSCRRVYVDERGRATVRLCAGDPITGADHAPAAMTRTPPANTTPVVLSLPRGSGRGALARRLVSLDELERMVATDRASPPAGYCPMCGPLVEVDNPIRREVRHRRGCPAGG